MEHIRVDSERSDECIDFTMIITSRNSASISNFGGGFRWKSEYSWCIIETTEIFDFYANFFLKCRSNFYEICRKRENLQVSNVKYSSLTNHLRSESFKLITINFKPSSQPPTSLQGFVYSKKTLLNQLKSHFDDSCRPNISFYRANNTYQSNLSTIKLGGFHMKKKLVTSPRIHENAFEINLPIYEFIA
ncbi:hypothetical protein AGLY_006207 [Aphis glycines]|uniref:Uncharacterized protein n=1 Tax=Aphis glycines TaxID=307491 RepID=A0A6G0TQH8_APHGL|nr:hypothetical protein AGLY_006207 [Aphis glycines]